MANTTLDDLRRRIERLEAQLKCRPSDGERSESRYHETRDQTRSPKSRFFRSLFRASFDGFGALTEMITGLTVSTVNRSRDTQEADDDRDRGDGFAEGFADALEDLLGFPFKVADRLDRRSRQR